MTNPVAAPMHSLLAWLDEATAISKHGCLRFAAQISNLEQA